MGDLNELPPEPKDVEPIGIFPCLLALAVIMGSIYAGAYITLSKFWSGAM